jgi:ribosomal protein L7/L12
MERPTDETLWAQYAAAALTTWANEGEEKKVARYAAENADAMLAEHRKRFPASPKIASFDGGATSVDVDGIVMRHHAKPNGVISAIKEIRERIGLGLPQAKALFEQHRDALRAAGRIS